MFRPRLVLLMAALFTLACSGCASHSVLPRTKALFPGLDESHLSAAAISILSKAKQDFQCVRACGKACHASDAGRVPHSQSRRFMGDGYQITLVNASSGFNHREGVEIVIDSNITGGKPFHYEEIDATDD